MSNIQLWHRSQDLPFTVGGRHVDPALRRISYGEQTSEVEPRVLAVLIALAQRPGQTVRREELIDEVWSGAPGADQSLNNAISLLRRALQDLDAGERVVKTVPKQGYQLCADVERPAGSTIQQERGFSPAPNSIPNGLNRWRFSLIAGAFLAGLAIVAALFAPRDHIASPALTSPQVAPNSIAVLPFSNLSGSEEDAYFADGLAEEIVFAISQLRTLEVAPRASSFQFRDTGTPLQDIARSLQVANVLEGSVRRDGEKLRVTAELISARYNRNLWSSTYDRTIDDVLAIQQDIADNIANSLALEIGGETPVEFASMPTSNPEAYEHFLIGKHELRKWTPDGNRRAVQHLERAVELDLNFAEAHLALGRAYYFAATHYGWMNPSDAIPKVKASLVYGVSSDHPATRSAALDIYADVLAWSDHDWRGALAAYKRAYELSGTPSLGYGLTNSIIGNHDVAIAIFRELVESGVGSAGINNEVAVRNNLAWALFNARLYDDALVEAERVISADAAYADGYRVIGRADLLLDRHEDAIEAFSKAATLTDRAPAALSDLAVASARSGYPDLARQILDELESTEAYIDPALIAQIYANLGDEDAAFSWLERAMTDNSRSLMFLKINPLYDPVRGDPRFIDLLVRLNLAS